MLIWYEIHFMLVIYKPLLNIVGFIVGFIVEYFVKYTYSTLFSTMNSTRCDSFEHDWISKFSTRPRIGLNNKFNLVKAKRQGQKKLNEWMLWNINERTIHRYLPISMNEQYMHY